jgi:hypothetical protein
MKLSRILCLFLAGLSLSATAQTKVKSKSKAVAKKDNFRLLEAYSQRTLPGIPNGPVEVGYHFIVIWQNAKYPETFFWRGDNGWMTCKIEKAHSVTGHDTNVPKGLDYGTEFVTGDQIHKGDTLALTPVKGGRYPIPAEIPATAKNTLYYKVGGSKWLSFPVKNIGKKPDVAMP